MSNLTTSRFLILMNFATTISTTIALAIGVPVQAFAADDFIKIGLMPSLTGIEQGESDYQLKAADLAVEQINSSGGVKGRKIKLVVEDAKSGPEGAALAYAKLIDEDKVVAVIGPSKSAQTVAMLPKSSQAGILTFTGGTNPRLTEGNRWIVRLRPDDNVAAAAVVEFIKNDLKETKIAVIHDNGAFGRGGADLIEKHCREYGVQVVKRIGFAIGDRDFAGGINSAIKSAQDAGAKVLISYVASYDDQAAVMRATAKFAKGMHYFGSPSSTSKVSVGTNKDAADGMYAWIDVIFGSTPVNSKYLADYRAKYKAEPDPVSVYIYDSLKILAKALEEVGDDPVKLRSAVLGIQGYQGVLGNFSFTPNGDGLHAITVVKFEGGKIKPVKVIGR